jgi:hypothetical protein
MAMMAITTNSSISVNPLRFRADLDSVEVKLAPNPLRALAPLRAGLEFLKEFFMLISPGILTIQQPHP